MEKLEQPYPVIYQLYLSNPLCVAVLLNNRAFWTPASATPRLAATGGAPAAPVRAGRDHDRGSACVFLWFAQMMFASARGPIRGEALMAEAIVVDGVTKRFKLANQKTLKKLALNAVKRRQLSRRLTALDDISFTLGAGRVASA